MNWTAYLLVGIGVLAAFLVWTFLYVRGRIRRRLARIQAASIFHALPRISLKRLEPFKWSKTGRAERRVAAFRNLGFEDVGGFTVSGDGGARIFLLRHPVSGHAGIVQERGLAGTWSDVAFFQSGSAQPIYASNVLKKAHFFLFPGDPKIHLPDASEADLVEAVGKAAGVNAVAVHLNSDNAPGLLEAAHAMAADARLQKPLEDWELRRLLREHGGECGDEELTDVQLQRIKEQIPFVIANELRVACREQFLRDGTISAREWQQARSHLLVVHDRAELTELDDRMNQAAYCTPTLKTRLKSLAKQSETPRAQFAEMNDTLPPWERYKKLGEVARPVPADIYFAPKKRMST